MAVSDEREHVCDTDRRVDFELFQLRTETAGLEAEIDAYLSSAQGRFEQWFAERERRPERPDEQSAEPDEPDEPGG